MPPRVHHAASGLAKVSSGIAGFDEITGGGLPRGRPTLICGGPGCGKTLFGVEFLIGAAARGEPGVFVSFEEPGDDLATNVRSLGYDLGDLVRGKALSIEYVRIERAEIEETGEYDLEGLFIRLDHALRSIGARRIVLDSIESLFAGLSNEGLLRAELRRLFAWLKKRRITAVITGERGSGALSRHGLEEYISDCVILLDHRVDDQISTRRLRIVKYRGTAHGTNEPLRDRLSGDCRAAHHIPAAGPHGRHRSHLDRAALAGRDAWRQGYFRGSSVLLSGGPGTAKTSLAAHLLDAACRRGERAFSFLLEESPAQYLRNMRSIGVDLEPWRTKGLLTLHAARPSLYGLESHLIAMHRMVESEPPSVVVIDPISSFIGSSATDVNSMLIRLIDLLKGHGVTGLFTHLFSGSSFASDMEAGVSSLMDTWVLLQNTPSGSQVGRQLSILKSRGMRHESRERTFQLTDQGAVAADARPGRRRRARGSRG